MKKTWFVGVCLVLAWAASLAQEGKTGFLRGKVTDQGTGEGLFGATIRKQGTTQGVVSDFEGNFSLSMTPGTHTIVVQFVSYQTKTMEGVEVKAGKVTMLDIPISEDVKQLDGVMVTAEQVRDNEVALLAMQRKAVNMMDGISAAAFKKIGDGDLGQAMKRVTGVSVEGGKYIYVRGLGDRYTQTTLNGLAVPGLDPDRNAVQMDLFPTGTIENVVVYKTFSPDLQGNFSGGSVDVETKSFPEKKTTILSIGLGYNPAMHLKSDYLSYQGGKTDLLGFDDGTRQLPFSKTAAVPDPSSGKQVLETYTRAFKPVLSAQRQQNFLNTSLSFTHGNQINKEKATIGYQAIFNYQNNTEYYDHVQFGEYRKENERAAHELVAVNTRQGQQGIHNVQWSALLSGAVKFGANSLALNFMRSQNGNSSALSRTSDNQDDNPSTLKGDILTYTQRSVTNIGLVGKHQVGEVWKLDWRAAANFASISDPDMRSTRIEINDDGSYGLNTGVGAGIDRFFRDLKENSQILKVDFSRPYGENNKLKFGAIGTFKKRNFEVLDYVFTNRGDRKISGIADSLLAPQYIWTPQTDRGTYVQGNFDQSKQYEASQNVWGAYMMTEMSLTEKFKAIYGVRAEQAMIWYTGTNQQRDPLNHQRVLNAFNLLPSINLVYALNENMNLRASYNSTLARPSLKEKSNAQIWDPISNRTFIGNLDLKQTTINNYDLRWEYFYSPTEMLSVSGFYKHFKGHIELVSFPTAPNQIKPRNAGNSQVFGVEVEFRKDIDLRFSFGANASWIHSMVDLKSVVVDENGKTEYQLRKENLKQGEEVMKSRPMSGQSPYLINGYVNYKSLDQALQANLSYNVQGKTLYIIGSGQTPDVYTLPFHSLNFNISRTLGEKRRSKVSFAVQNILDAKQQQVYQSYQAKDRFFSRYQPGRTFSVKYTYTF